MGAMLAAILVVRLTEKPIRIGFSITEDAANQFTTVAINMPAVGTVNLRTRGAATAIGFEIMKVRTNLLHADQEPGQQNRVQYGISKGAAPTAVQVPNNQLMIWGRDRRTLSEDATGIEHKIDAEDDFWDDLTDGDGNGEVISDGEIHAWVAGTGNAAAKQFDGYLLGHLIELDTEEAIFEMIEQSQ